MYEIKTGEGKKIMIVSHHPADKDHDCAHWHASKAQLDDHGGVRTRTDGSWKYESGGSVVTHD